MCTELVTQYVNSVWAADEPTNAMDPWTEMNWLPKQRELVKGRTAILITHRQTTAMRADVIHVMQDSRLIDRACR